MIAALALAAAATVPAAWQGQWAREGGRCTAGLQMEGILTIFPHQIAHGEKQLQVRAIRRATRSTIAVDSRNTADGIDSWTATTLFTLSDRGRRLVLEQTRHNGNRLREGVPEVYRRCR